MIEPTAADIGRAVVYRPAYNPWPAGTPEQGKIVSFNRDWVFVRYPGGWNAKATARGDLEWAFPAQATDPEHAPA